MSHQRPGKTVFDSSGLLVTTSQSRRPKVRRTFQTTTQQADGNKFIPGGAANNKTMKGVFRTRYPAQTTPLIGTLASMLSGSADGIAGKNVPVALTQSSAFAQYWLGVGGFICAVLVVLIFFALFDHCRRNTHHKEENKERENRKYTMFATRSQFGGIGRQMLQLSGIVHPMQSSSARQQPSPGPGLDQTPNYSHRPSFTSLPPDDELRRLRSPLLSNCTTVESVGGGGVYGANSNSNINIHIQKDDSDSNGADSEEQVTDRRFSRAGSRDRKNVLLVDSQYSSDLTSINSSFEEAVSPSSSRQNCWLSVTEMTPEQRRRTWVARRASVQSVNRLQITDAEILQHQQDPEPTPEPQPQSRPQTVQEYLTLRQRRQSRGLSILEKDLPSPYNLRSSGETELEPLDYMEVISKKYRMFLQDKKKREKVAQRRGRPRRISVSDQGRSFAGFGRGPRRPRMLMYAFRLSNAPAGQSRDNYRVH